MGIYLAQGIDYSDSYPSESEAIGLSTCSRPNVHGQLRFTCTGPTVMVRVMADYILSADPGKVAVWVDGVFSSTITPTVNLQWYPVTIPAGSHLVEIQAGQQSGPAWPSVTGAWADALFAPDLVVPPRATSAKWLIVEHDSIGNGQPTNPGVEDWVTLLRQAVKPFGWRVACYSYGFRSLGDQTDHAGVARQLDLMCPGATTVRILNALGTNDYGLPKESAAAYATLYAARIAACKAQFGARLDKYFVVTPFKREVESANGFSNTLTDYCNAGIAQVTGNVVLIDAHTGVLLVVGTDYADSPGLHPNTAGHAKVAAYIAPLAIA